MRAFNYENARIGRRRQQCWSSARWCDNWPALTAASGSAASGDWTTVTRDDGTMQWAYKGKPLYTFAKDTKPGDTTGDGFLNGAWHIAKP